MGDVVVVAAADDEEEGVEPPLALLQALWQTAKGQHTALILRKNSIFSTVLHSVLLAVASERCQTKP